MKLWLISQTENDEYDTYSDAVVAADTAEEASNIHPDGSMPLKKDYSWNCCWVSDPKKVKVELIGTAKVGTKKGVICASFHAG